MENKVAGLAPKTRRGLDRFMRVKLVIALLALFALGLLGVYFFLGGWLKGVIESRGSAMLGARISMDSLRVNPFTQRITVDNLQVADPDNTMENMFQAKRIRASVSALALFSAQLVVNEMIADEPALRVARTEDGSFNVVKPATKSEPGLSEKALEKLKQEARQRDWVADIKWLLEKTREWRERKAKEPPRQPKRKNPGRIGGTTIEFPAPPGRPRLLLRRVELRDMTISFADGPRAGETPPLKHATLRINDLALPPAEGAEPFVVSLEGQFGDDPAAKLSLNAKADVRRGRPQGSGELAVRVGNFPLAAYSTWYAASWPVDFKNGVANLEAQFSIEGETVNGRAKTGAAGVSIAGKPGHKKVLGLSPAELDRALQSAGDLEFGFVVGGPYYGLRTDLPEAIARALKNKGADIAESYVRGRADEELKKLREKLEKDSGVALPKDLGAPLEKGLRNILGR